VDAIEDNLAGGDPVDRTNREVNCKVEGPLGFFYSVGSVLCQGWKTYCCFPWIEDKWFDGNDT